MSASDATTVSPLTYTSEQIATTAARWWAESVRLRRRGSVGAIPEDALHALVHNLSPAPTDDEVDRVERAIHDAVIRELDRGVEWLSLDTDYGPQGVLLKALRSAGLNPPLPVKTMMSVRRDGIDVECGHRAACEVLPIVELDNRGRVVSTSDVPLPSPPTYTFDQIARTAARWWAESVRSCQSGSVGDPLQDGLRAIIYALTPPLPDDTDRLERLIYHAVMCELEGGSTAVWLTTDYHPRGVLAHALRSAGLNPPLPLKTRMAVRRDGVKVACGYGANLTPVPIVASADAPAAQHV